MWNPETNEFGSYDNKGKTKIYFKPGRKDYFDDQKGVEINE